MATVRIANLRAFIYLFVRYVRCGSYQRQNFRDNSSGQTLRDGTSVSDTPEHEDKGLGKEHPQNSTHFLTDFPGGALHHAEGNVLDPDTLRLCVCVSLAMATRRYLPTLVPSSPILNLG